MTKNKQDDKVIIVVEPTIKDTNYIRAIRKIINRRIVSDVVVTFLDSKSSNICGEIKSIKKEKKRKRVLVINENSSHESVVAALNWVANSGDNQENQSLIKGDSLISLRAAY